MAASVGIFTATLAQDRLHQAACKRSSVAIHTRLHKPGGFIQQRRLLSVSAVHPGSVAAQKQQYSSLEQLVQESDLPVLVEFYATWCGPCQMMGRTMEAVAPTMKDRVKFVKIDSEKYGRLANQYRIHGLPTLILFKQGKVADRVEGMLPENDFRMWLQQRI